MKILLVEDDPELRETLHTCLNKAGHCVDTTPSYNIAQWLITEQEYNLLILDWVIEEGTGIELCQNHRRGGKNTPILMLTARDSSASKVAGLDAGADDYVVKPIDIPELLARVRALGRRIPTWQGSILHFGDLQLHLDTHIVSYQGKETQLSVKEVQLLSYFCHNPRQILSRERIEQALWSWETELGYNALTVQIRRLRQRLQEIGCGNWIQTVYGAGYRFCHEE